MDTKKLAKIYKALSNENRLGIFKEILEQERKKYKGGCFINEILKKFKIGAPTVSHHLKELTNAELIKTKKEGKYLIVSINKELLNEMKNEFDF